MHTKEDAQLHFELLGYDALIKGCHATDGELIRFLFVSNSLKKQQKKTF